MRDPWFPIALMLIVLLACWLGIVGPMPDGVAAWLQKWQTLAAAFVASIAAYIAVQNTTRSLTHAEGLEKHRRSRKHAALRAVLPLALSQVDDYASHSAHALNELISKCSDEALPVMSVSENQFQPFPPETVRTLADFIEYSDEVDVGIIESTVALIQIHDSRLRDLAKENCDAASSHLTVRTEIEGYIIDAATIYAGAAAVYEYARRRQDQLPSTLSWDDVRSALRNMRFWDDQYPRLKEGLIRRESLRAGPFERARSILDLRANEVH